MSRQAQTIPGRDEFARDTEPFRREARESLRLGLIACLQYLPARQRAVLILRDVLAFPAAEVAVMLGTSTVAVKSMLQRARARLEQVAPSPDEVSEPAEPEARALLVPAVPDMPTQVVDAPGDWRMAATAANGQPAAAAYLRGADGVHRAFGLAVLTVTATGIARIVVFGDPGLVTRFGFPPVP